jgi:hypothetical protein
LIFVVDGAGDHHTRLNPTLARLLLFVTPSSSPRRLERLCDPLSRVSE